MYLGKLDYNVDESKHMIIGKLINCNRIHKLTRQFHPNPVLDSFPTVIILYKEELKIFLWKSPYKWNFFKDSQVSGRIIFS